MKIFDFVNMRNISHVKNFWKLDNDDIPESPGAYILIARNDINFIYPKGKSPIFYIGQSKNLNRRLKFHLKTAKEARDKRKYYVYLSRYEYAAKYGSKYCFIKTWQGLSPRALEGDIMGRFTIQYLSPPVANGAGSWNRITKIIDEIERTKKGEY
jgi:GIY-YIG catalytic domain